MSAQKLLSDIHNKLLLLVARPPNGPGMKLMLYRIGCAAGLAAGFKVSAT